VYDCGSDNAEFLTREIASTSLGEINALTLSHFDRDHINGLDHLFRQNNVDIVFIPYLTPMERLLLAVKHSDADPFYYRFLFDPVMYLLDKNPNKIVVVGRGDGKSINEFSEASFTNNNNQRSVGIDYMKEDKNLRDKIEKNDPSVINNHVLVCNDLGFSTIGLRWFLKFYNKSLNKSKLDILEAAFRKNGINNQEDAKAAVLDPDKRKKLRAAYRGVWKDLNSTSLVLYCGPTGKHECKLDVENLYCNKDYWWFYTPPYFRRSNQLPSFAQLLLGDAEFDSVSLQEFLNHYGLLLQNVRISLMPHHGSKHNWDPRFLGLLYACEFWVASSGFSNKHGHPDLNAVLQIMDAGNAFIHITELTGVNFGGYIDW